MPLYEYQCPRCGRFETIRKFSDSPLAACPTCGGEVQKLLSAPAIQFKGTGWYVTDYARKSSGGDGSAAAKEAPAAKGSDASANSKESGASSGTSASGTSASGTSKDGSASGGASK